MATDPFPNTTDATLEVRLSTLFNATDTVLVVPVDPEDKKNGMIWLNSTERKLKIYAGGITWTTGVESA